MRRALPLFLALALLAPAAAQRPRLPQLEGRPIWHVPLREAPADVQRAIELHRETRAARLRPTRGATDEWSRDVMQPWLMRTREAIAEIERSLARDDTPPAPKLLGAILVADLYEHFGSELLAVPPPAALAADAELAATFVRTLHESADPILERAARVFEQCEAMALSAPPPIDAWATRCRERGVALLARVASSPASTPREPPVPLRGAESLPSVCARSAPRVGDEGPAPDLASPLEIVVLPLSSRWTPRDAERIAQEVERTLARRGLPMVSSREARRARTLQTDRRARAGGPVCAVASSLASLLADAHPNLAYAIVWDTCAIGGCSLDVRFQRPSRTAPIPNDTQVPRETFHAPIARMDPRASDWVAAARRLEPQGERVLGMLGALNGPAVVDVFGESGGLGVLGGATGLGGGLGDVFVPRFHVAMPEGDPTFVPSVRVYERERALRACFRGMGTVGFRFALDVDERGAVADAEIAILEGALSGSDRAVANVRACFERAMRETTFPCPPAGPTRVEGHVCLEPEPRAVGVRAR
ncbi:MAG: hypothetical protein MUE69_00930 [Myxococcota bacterium]|jgi:hypothetical protein|nr:hypothetical protein [Myxococcota bacterium]